MQRGFPTQDDKILKASFTPATFYRTMVFDVTSNPCVCLVALSLSLPPPLFLSPPSGGASLSRPADYPTTFHRWHYGQTPAFQPFPGIKQHNCNRNQIRGPQTSGSTYDPSETDRCSSFGPEDLSRGWIALLMDRNSIGRWNFGRVGCARLEDHHVHLVVPFPSHRPFCSCSMAFNQAPILPKNPSCLKKRALFVPFDQNLMAYDNVAIVAAWPFENQGRCPKEEGMVRSGQRDARGQRLCGGDAPRMKHPPK